MSTYWADWKGYDSHAAVDGDRSNNLDSYQTGSPGPCIHTKSGERNPWWEVDLEHDYNVRAVIITNRGDVYGKI